ncbi:MAG TPA: acetyl-CoA carboxylase biotin carboxyl carrier protein [Limnochordia bacterium]|nr:acetyl-CoA carboxylase biotin carboxyl carrier protein [Limnochordia bacterium]
MELTIDEIRALVQLLDESDVAELQLESEGFKLRLRKPSAFKNGLPVAPAPIYAPAPLAQPSESAAPVAPKDEASPAEAALADQTLITAPMVGTFYRASSPEAEPFVKVGDEIEPGQAICIIEAMKLFNEIESEVKGRIAKILVENGQSVEYGQPLFVVEAASPTAGV